MKHLKKIISMVLILTAFGCMKVEDQSTAAGTVSFTLSTEDNVADQTKSAVSNYTSLPTVDDFVIEIAPVSVSTTFTWRGQIGDWDPSTMVPAGSYKVTATYGSLEEEGFDKPFFTGETNFTITAQTGDAIQPVNVSIEVSLGNTVVLVRCTDNFKNYYNDYTFKLSRDGSDIVDFVKDETKAAFIDAYKFKLEGSIMKGDKSISFDKEYTNLDVATAYTILFDVANVGGTAITISFNDTVETVELGDLELNE